MTTCDRVQAKSHLFRWSKTDMRGRSFKVGSKVRDHGKRTELQQGDGVQVKSSSFQWSWKDMGRIWGVK